MSDDSSRILIRSITDEMQTSYIDYAMSVIIGRALPDVRDGLKPVHRRVLYSMYKMGLFHDKPYKKSARIVGDVLGQYHPHGDTAVYDALVRMVQDFSMRVPMIDGQGNFGSIDNDPPAAMRYTEVRLCMIAREFLADIYKDTVNFTPNYDETQEEPVVLPSKFPNFIVNGSSGIAVGMATNVPPHNLGEVCNAICAYIDNPDLSDDDLFRHMKGPDFPTGGTLINQSGIVDYFATGYGKFKLRANHVIESNKSGSSIVIHEIPYQVNKSSLIKNIADLSKDKKIDGIVDILDESSRAGIRVVIDVRRDIDPNIVLNQLYRMSQLEVSFGVIMLSVVNGRPKVLPMKEVLGCFVDHRCDVIQRRTQYDLDKSVARQHILYGLLKALNNLDVIVKVIRSSNAVSDARAELMKLFSFSLEQVKSILDMRLHSLTSLEVEKVDHERKELVVTIENLKLILDNKSEVFSIIKSELNEINQSYSNDRRTTIDYQAGDLNIEDLISNEPVVVTLSQLGYVKRTSLSIYRSQSRGGKGFNAFSTKDGDCIHNLIITTTLSNLLLFSNIGRVYRLSVYKIPDFNRTSRGKALINLLDLSPNENITSTIAVESFKETVASKDHLLLCTQQGVIKKSLISDYKNIRTTGIIAIKLKDKDQLVAVKRTDGNQYIFLGTSAGKVIRFHESHVRNVYRTGQGVRGIQLNSKENDRVIGMEIAPDSDERASLLTICENGYGKRTLVKNYPTRGRAGKGVITIRTTKRNGKVIGIKMISSSDKDDVMLMTTTGLIIRLRCQTISVISRNTNGVLLVRLANSSNIATITSFNEDLLLPPDDYREEKETSTDDLELPSVN